MRRAQGALRRNQFAGGVQVVLRRKELAVVMGPVTGGFRMNGPGFRERVNWFSFLSVAWVSSVPQWCQHCPVLSAWAPGLAQEVHSLLALTLSHACP